MHGTRIQYSIHVRIQKFREGTDLPLVSHSPRKNHSCSIKLSFRPVISVFPSPKTTLNLPSLGQGWTRSLSSPSIAPCLILYVCTCYSPQICFKKNCLRFRFMVSSSTNPWSEHWKKMSFLLFVILMSLYADYGRWLHGGVCWTAICSKISACVCCR